MIQAYLKKQTSKKKNQPKIPYERIGGKKEKQAKSKVS